ncbi:flavin reductase [Mesorhizobium xinjiangense]|uniref:flavin reductase n=1 Tax=Mesorhizobium xinjiangense TaxID=2678685 RepID=UPI0012EE3890|nr:flavin reductase [Mesorhizobium xinjiangense]
MLKKSQIEPKHYRDAMANFSGAVHIVTTDGPAGRRGVTAIAACSVSDNPATALVCLNRENRANDCFVENGVFALNTLSADQEPLASHFSGLTGLAQDDRFAAADWELLTTGAPALVNGMAVFDCELIEAKDLATHRILIGKVTGLNVGDTLDPLIYFNRAYRTLKS